MTQEYIGTKQVTAWEGEKDGQPGYYVKYADGYVSWSPKEVFEAAYIELGNISHLPGHQQRVLGERAQLAVKMAALEGFTKAEGFAKIDPAEQQRLTIQVDAMRIYHDVLMDRIGAF